MPIKKFKKSLIWPLLILVTASFTMAQKAPGKRNSAEKSPCKIGSLSFTCPPYYVRKADLDRTTAVFKYKDGKSLLYFFVTDPANPASVDTLEMLISKLFSPTTTFKWKELTDPIIMEINTKFKREVRSVLGFDGKHLVNIKIVSIDWEGRPLLFGYAWDWRQDDPIASFSTSEDTGDFAPGCNAVAWTLNSITREFSDPDQGCTLSALIN